MSVPSQAELARLTPSGQVAEDEKTLAEELDSPRECRCADCLKDKRAALSRLAAQAQGYEAALEAMDEDGAMAKGDTSLAGRIQALSEDRMGEKVRAERAEEERDAAVADNAALVALWRERGCLDLGPKVDSEKPSSCIEQGWPLTEHGSCPACRATGVPHPGAALLAEHAKALVRARNEGREEAALAAQDAARCQCSGWNRCECKWEDRLSGLVSSIRYKKEPES